MTTCSTLISISSLSILSLYLPSPSSTLQVSRQYRPFYFTCRRGRRLTRSQGVSPSPRCHLSSMCSASPSPSTSPKPFHMGRPASAPSTGITASTPLKKPCIGGMTCSTTFTGTQPVMSASTFRLAAPARAAAAAPHSGKGAGENEKGALLGNSSTTGGRDAAGSNTA